MRSWQRRLVWHLVILAAGWAGICIAAAILAQDAPLLGGAVFFAYVIAMSLLRPLLYLAFPARATKPAGPAASHVNPGGAVKRG